MGKSDTVTILLNGDLQASDALRANVKNTFVIAADAGIRHAESLQIMPDIWVGDFDSSTPLYFEDYPSVEQIQHPSDKNQSDGELAVEAALARHPARIIICGALNGKRTDHMMFIVLSALNHALKHPDTEFYLTSGDETALPIIPGKELRLPLQEGTIISIIPFSPLTGLSIEGVKWPLRNQTVALGSTHTLSNISAGSTIINLVDGYAVALVQGRTGK